MGTNTNIAWCDHTFNSWRGCVKVSAGCANCYAEKLSLRNPSVLGEWGKDGERPIAAESYWRLPERWNAQARNAKTRRRVFCASLGDVFEDRPDLIAPRIRLFQLISRTPYLDWLLLTKRPENIQPLLRQIPTPKGNLWDTHWVDEDGEGYAKHFPNVWLGTSAENQEAADTRIPLLLEILAVVRFVVCEPLLGRIDLRPYFSASQRQYTATYLYGGLDWVIVGGESGTKARPMNVNWAWEIREHCAFASVPFFFKQHGEYIDKSQVCADGEFHADTPLHTDGKNIWYRVGKKLAGNLLNGTKFEQFPLAR